jgi:UDP-2-acetamido-2-deoxy-ribo-hexuluronate aminotransferase
MDTLQCAVVLAKLERFGWEVEQRRHAAAAYDELLRPQVSTIGCQPDRSSVYAQYTVLVDERDRVRTALEAADIPTAVHYPVPIHRQPAYAHLARGQHFPVADAMAARVLSLPMGPYLDAASVHKVARALTAACSAPLAAPAPA